MFLSSYSSQRRWRCGLSTGRICGFMHGSWILLWRAVSLLLEGPRKGRFICSSADFGCFGGGWRKILLPFSPFCDDMLTSCAFSNRWVGYALHDYQPWSSCLSIYVWLKTTLDRLLNTCWYLSIQPDCEVGMMSGSGTELNRGFRHGTSFRQGVAGGIEVGWDGGGQRWDCMWCDWSAWKGLFSVKAHGKVDLGLNEIDRLNLWFFPGNRRIPYFPAKISQ